MSTRPRWTARVNTAYLAEHRRAGIAWVNGVHYAAFLPHPDGKRYRLQDPNERSRRP